MTISRYFSIIPITCACIVLGMEHGAWTGISVWLIAYTLLWNSWK